MQLYRLHNIVIQRLWNLFIDVVAQRCYNITVLKGRGKNEDENESEAITMTRHNNIWYAVMQDSDDNDHGTGSKRYAEALRMARRLRRDSHAGAYIAVIDTADDYCIAEVHDLSDTHAPRI